MFPHVCKETDKATFKEVTMSYTWNQNNVQIYIH